MAISVFSDLKVLYHLLVKPVRGDTHAQRMESFYGGQAAAYDDFRRRLLQGRESLYQQVPVPEGGTWIDLGGGTGANVEYLRDRLASFKQVTVVDLSESLLSVAQQRFAERGWENVRTCHADATTFQPHEPADVVTFSYSLTMIPDWFAALQNAWDILKPGGRLGIVDFYVSRKHATEGHAQHSWATRHFWPFWFSHDNVFPNADHLPFAERLWDTERLEERRAKIPYLPLIRAPYYIYVGRKREQACTDDDSCKA